MGVGRCKFCEETRHLVNAHIIPRAFYPITGNSEKPMMVLANDSQWAKRSHQGIYDKALVCQVCEDQFNPWDTYAAEFLVQGRHQRNIKFAANHYVVYGFDYSRLKLFFLSLLWRASATDHRMYHKISLGIEEKKLKKLIQLKDPGTEEDFSAILIKYFNRPAAKLIAAPYSVSWNNVKAYEFTLGGYCVMIKAEDKPTPVALKQAVLAPRKLLEIGLQDFKTSLVHDLALELAQTVPAPPWALK